ncbi:MAG: hypothetical protein HFJ44_03980 [Clostridia bacterium]|nr:hypothetical protein [Clostridia bacterium]
MNKENYKKALKQVYMILKSLGKDIIDKIPIDMLNFIEENMDKDYFFVLDENIELEEQELMDETLGIISLIWRDYLCSDEERKKLQAEDSERQKQFENEQRKKYNPDNIFKKMDEDV